MPVIAFAIFRGEYFEALHPLLSSHTDQVMLCSDDLHPDDLALGHMDRLAARAVQRGHDPFDVLRCLCLNPIHHYRLPLGRLRVGDPMEAALVTDLEQFRVEATWLGGQKVAERGRSLLARVPVRTINRFNARSITPEQLRIPSPPGRVRVILALEGEIITQEQLEHPNRIDGTAEPDPGRDLLEICVLNRYAPSPLALGFVRGFGLKDGAIASSVAHDSHNIVAVGANRQDLATAINTVSDHRGGLVLVNRHEVQSLPLPIAGLMSDDDGDAVAARYRQLDQLAKDLGSTLSAPFMKLTFMALLVIPELKLSDQGLFDGRRFQFTPLAVDT
jgi:adenine deaminase